MLFIVRAQFCCFSFHWQQWTIVVWRESYPSNVSIHCRQRRERDCVRLNAAVGRANSGLRSEARGCAKTISQANNRTLTDYFLTLAHTRNTPAPNYLFDGPGSRHIVQLIALRRVFRKYARQKVSSDKPREWPNLQRAYARGTIKLTDWRRTKNLRRFSARFVPKTQRTARFSLGREFARFWHETARRSSVLRRLLSRSTWHEETRCDATRPPGKKSAEPWRGHDRDTRARV